MNNGLRAALAAPVVAVVALSLAEPANADNSNANTNTNDVTNLGGDGVDAGASGTESTNWPPTDLTWPPSAVSNGDISGKNNDNSPVTPIVMPVGQDSPTNTSETSSPETAKPIVPIGAP